MRPPHQRHQAQRPCHRQPVKAENCQHPHQQAQRLGDAGPEVSKFIPSSLQRELRAAPPEDKKLPARQNSAMIGSDHQLMSFSQDPIGSAIGSANAITVPSGLIPRGRLIGRGCPTGWPGAGGRDEGGFGGYVRGGESLQHCPGIH